MPQKPEISAGLMCHLAQMQTIPTYLTIQGGVEIPLAAYSYRNQEKLYPDGPLGSYIQTTFFTTPDHFIHDSYSD